MAHLYRENVYKTNRSWDVTALAKSAFKIL